MKRAYVLRHFFAAALLVVCTFATSQKSAAQLSFTISNAPVSSLSIGDIDFKNGGSTSWLFTLNIIDPTHATHNNVTFSMALNINLVDGTSYSNAVTATTQPFTVPNGQLTVSNIDLSKGSTIKLSNFTYSQDAENNLKKQALGTGKLPAGTYSFTFTLFDGGSQSGSPQTITFNLQNNTVLSLISPSDQSTVPNPFPFFQWQYNGSNLELAVFEFTSTMHSKEEAASGVPMLDVKTGDPAYPNFPAASNTFQYPSAGVRPLQPGHTYVWRVTGLTSGSGGSTGNVNTDLWQFTIAGGGSQTDTTGNSNVSGSVVTLYGTPGDIIAGLGNGTLTLTGNMTINGVPISAADVQKILNELAQNPDEIINITITQ